MTESGYLESICKHCGSKIYQAGSDWTHAWGPDCAIRLTATPKFTK